MSEEKVIMKSGLMLGVNPNTERHSEDFYATEPNALILFIERLKLDGIEINKKVWECACGKRHLANVLLDYGHEVRMTDLVKRIDGVCEEDFLGIVYTFDGDILTNPPFNLAEKFVEKGMELLEGGNKLFLFLKIQFLEGQKRKELFRKYPPKYVYCYSARQKCARDGEFEKYTATTQFYAWFVWEKGYKGDTIIRWI
jgi:hypothetical protein